MNILIDIFNNQINLFYNLMRYDIDHYIVNIEIINDFNWIYIVNLKNNIEYEEFIYASDYEYLKTDNIGLSNLFNKHFLNNKVIIKNNYEYLTLIIKLDDILDKIKIPKYNKNNSEKIIAEQNIKIANLEDKVNFLYKLIAPTYNIYIDNNNNIYKTNEEIIKRYTELLHLIIHLIVIATKIDPKYNKVSVNNLFYNKISLTNGIIYHFTQNNSSKVVKLFNELSKEYNELFYNELLIFNINSDKMSEYLNEYDKMTTLIKDKNLKNMVPKIEIPL